MRNHFRRYLFLTFVLILTIVSLGSVGTKDVDANSGPGIAIAPEYPKEQVRENGIFNVLYEPNKNYRLTLKVINTTNQDKTITISPNTAYTSNSGNIAFDRSNIPSDSSRKYDFRSLFEQKERKVNVPATSINKVHFDLKMPPEEFPGILSGGFYVTIPNDDSSNNRSNFSINNRFTYGLATVIHSNRTPGQPKISLGDINSNNSDDRLSVNTNIRNTGSGIISGMEVESQVTRANSNQIIAKSSQSNLSMAPNSSFQYNEPFNNSLTPGRYKVDMKIKDDNGNTWNQSKEFRINAQESVTQFTRNVPWLMYGMITTIVILVLVIIYMFYRLNKQQNKNNNQGSKDNDSKSK